eukprot:9494043-Pyramimonas_sp.AAC.1
MIHGCPYLPGDKRIQLGLRADNEVMALVGPENLIRDVCPVWRSAVDIIMTSGVQGRIAVSSLVQVSGVKRSGGECRCDRVGQAWVNVVRADTQRGNLPKFTSIPHE